MRFSGERLYQKRLAANMSRADVAHRVREISGGQIKASERSVRGWEKNEYVPAGETVPVLARSVGCAVDELYGAPLEDDEEEAASMPSYRELLDALRPLAELFNQQEKVA